MGPTVKSRLNKLCDPNSFTGTPSGQGRVFVTGTARINGRKAAIIATDPDPLDAPPDLESSMSGVIEALRRANSKSHPVIFLHDSPAQYQSGKTAFQGADASLMMGEASIGWEYYELGRLSGRVPLASGVFGNMAQAQAFPAVMSDGTVMLKESSVSVARPDAVEAMLGEKNIYQELGGARIHNRVIGDCDDVFDTEDEVLAWLRKFLSFLPSHNREAPPAMNPGSPGTGLPAVRELIPSRLNQPFEVRRVIDNLADEGQFLELGRNFAEEIVTGLARIKGLSTGIAANNPIVRGGVLFPESCRKLSRFIRFCDAFNLPIIFLADAPGFMIGRAVEKAGIVSSGAELFKTLARSGVPRLCIVLRRAYTAGLYAMSGSGFFPHGLYALPGSSIAVYGPEAVERFLAKLELPIEEKEKIRKKMADNSSPEALLAQSLITGIIEPEDLRDESAVFLKSMEGYRGV